jgi:D-glycero-D-manno-heptose 1,7-bisphosphate phosphatase
VNAARAGSMPLSAVFLDRDGVINDKAPEGEYVTSWAQFRFLPRALEGLAALASLDVPVIVATNQRGIARGALSEADLADIHTRMLAAVRAASGRIDAIYHCPHEGDCECRKPRPGMLVAAARDHGLQLQESVVVGDRRSDMEAAAAVSARGVLVTSSGERALPGEETATDLLSAARLLGAS